MWRPKRAESKAVIAHLAVAATLYQRRFAPLALAVEGFEVRWSGELIMAIGFLVIFTSLLGVSALYYLLRHGEATRVTSMMYLPPGSRCCSSSPGSAWRRARWRWPESR